jgi:hypothetical protein
MATLNIYESTRKPGTHQRATPGSASDVRFARSGRWRFVGAEYDGVLITPEPAARARAEHRIATQVIAPGEPGTFDGPASVAADQATEPDSEPEPRRRRSRSDLEEVEG